MSERPLEDSIRSSLRAAAPRDLPPHLFDAVSAIPRSAEIPARRTRLRLGLGGAFAVFLTLTVMASVALLAPRATSLFGAPSLGPKPSATPAAASSGGPVTICGVVPPSYKGVFIPFLQCDDAISAALTSLPKEHAEIARIEFGFGDYCAATAPCATGIDLLKGWVVVGYASGPRTLVLVRDESAQSGVSVTGSQTLP